MPTLTESNLETIQSLYDRGLYLQAYEASKELGPLAEWRGVDGRILAGRLAGNLGSDRLQIVSHWLAFREYPENDQALCYAARTMIRRWGPYFAIRWMDRHANRAFTDDTHRGEWHGILGVCNAMLRDQKQADAHIAKAYEIAPKLPWLAIEHASILEKTDRYEQAYEVALKALDDSPSYRPAVQTSAHLLVLLSRQDEAIQLIEDAIPQLESGALHCQLGSMFNQRQRYEEAREQYEIGAEKMPLLDKVRGDAWLARIRSDLASACGDPDTALKLLADVPKRYKGHFHQQVEKSLENRPADATRKLLDVPFIRQHYRTCAPATLSMLAKYWGKEAEHLEIADAICFDGTPYHAERQWAQEAGYTVAEFTVDEASTVALIDRGVPFTFSTNEPDSGHLQAVIGYDTTRRVLLLRDPFYPSVGEMLIDSLDERYGAYGPRGMVLVPPDKAHLLNGLELTDQALWHQSHRLRSALIGHDRPTAEVALLAMQADDPQATLTLNAELSLANYDNHGEARTRIIETLVKRYPKCPALVPSRLGSLSERGLRQERLDLLREASEGEESSPALILRYALELAEDARQHGWAGWHFRRLIRRGSHNAEAYHGLGGLYWTLGRREEATELYRVASCIENLRERYALTLFRAKRFFRQEPEVLTFLTERFERLGGKDAGPARTLYEAHRLMSRADLGFEVLEQAIERRPEDGSLMLFLAEELSSYGRRERAAQMLEQAKPHCSALDWQRAAAALAYDLGQMAEARDHWREILEQSPLDLQAQRAWCGLTTRLEGQGQALTHLRSMVERFPHHWDLQCELYHELSEVDRDESLVVLQGLIDQLPNDTWAWREMGFVCAEMPGGLERARKAAERTRELDPNSVYTYNLLGRIAELSGDIETARDAYRKGVQLDPDASYPIERLIEQYRQRNERREAMRFVLDQLAHQVTFGDGVLTYQGVANRALPPQEVLEDLKRAKDDRPDLWQTWAALIDQLLLCERLADAAVCVEEATERFPLTPNLWYRRAEVHRVRLEDEGRVSCLEQALRIAPGYQAAVSELARAYEEQGDAANAERVLRQALDRAPRNARYHGHLANVLWRAGRPEEGLDHIEQAARLEPTISGYWELFISWSKRLGKPETPADTARELTESRPAEAGIWLNLAEVLDTPRDLDERLAALDRCLAIQPRHGSAHDLKAELLVNAHRYDEARAACNPPVYNGQPPINLAGRACWIDYQQGKTDQAIQGMWKIIEDEPTYLWGLKLLIDWCGAANDFGNQIRATDLLIKADPNDHIALGFRADARMQQANAENTPKAEKQRLRSEAKTDFDRASRLSPAYNFATDQLFNLHLEDGEPDEAQALLDRAGDYLTPESRLAMRIALACQRREKQAAENLFRELCVYDTDQAWVFGYAHDHAKKLGIALPILEEMCKDPKANPFIAEQFAYAVLVKTSSWKKAIRATDKLKHWPAGWDHAAGYLFNDMGERGNQEQHRSLVEKFYRKNRKRIVGSEHAWRGAIYALASMDLSFETIALFKNWQQRDDIEPWMLCNLANAYLAINQIKQAHTTVQAALDMPPDHSYPRHLIDHGYLLAIFGDPKTAEQVLDQVLIEKMPNYYQQAYHLARAMCQAQLAPTPAERRAKAKAHLRQARTCYPGYRNDRGQRKANRRTVFAIAKRNGLMGWLTFMPELLSS